MESNVTNLLPVYCLSISFCFTPTFLELLVAFFGSLGYTFALLSLFRTDPGLEEDVLQF